MRTKIKVLIVDDTAGWRDFDKNIIENVLSDYEYEITLAESAKDGYDRLLYAEKTPYDLIISDLQMESDFAPLTAGEWFIRQVQNFNNYYNTKILIISGMYNIEMVADSLNVDFISKRMLISGGELPLKFKLEEMGIIKSKE